ncbi:polymorphic toxin-type HINT domain-containing protein [Rubripirellula obstinata]|nr:polymorphic toxin-type HINT domain-containing protein [Rubripirellula obstinata]
MLSIWIAAATVRAESNGTIGWGDVANLETADWGWDEARIKSSATSDTAAAEVTVASMKQAARGQLDKRTQLLDAIDADTDLFHSLSGRIEDKPGTWIDIEQSIQTASEDRRLRLYYEQRNERPDTLAAHWSMAMWCMNNKLPARARAHLERVLFFNADHTPARRALGYVAMGGDWVAPDEVRRFQSDADFSRRSMRRYGREVHQIATRLESSSTRVVENAINKLTSIKDPLAGPAIESVLANRSPETAQLSLRWFTEVDTIGTSRTLCRFALFHPSPEIRKQATNALAERPLHEFVPELLGMIASKVDASILPIFDRNGLFIGVRKIFSQENINTQRVIVVNEQMVGPSEIRNTEIRNTEIRNTENRNQVGVETEIAPAGLPVELENAFFNAFNRDLGQAAYVQARIDAEATAQSVAQQNRVQQRRNEKISNLLSHIAGINFAGDSGSMWRWWDDVNEVELQESKYLRTSLVERNSPAVSFQAPPPRSCECFVSGTPVVTQRGPRPIESIVPGDFVLTQSLQTGTLDWKPVFQATHRPPADTLIVSAGKESLQCTRGHLFWVSGSGWKKASELKKGDLLHGAAEPQAVVEIQDGGRRQTHNLKVADNANYFVGQQRILTHDVTMRKPNRQPIPGYDLAVSLKE